MHRRLFVLSLIVLLLTAVVAPRARAQETPQGVDVVIVLDTSGALLDRIDVLCTNLPKDLAALKQRGFDLNVVIWAVAKPYGCATVTAKSLPESTVASDNDWGAAVTDIAAKYPWRSNTVRVIIPFSNRGPALGDPVDDPGPDRDTIKRAIAAAQPQRVSVSPLLGASDRSTLPADRSKLEALAADLAKGTGGQTIKLDSATSDPSLDIFRLIGQAVDAAATAPMLSIPNAVRTLTCQRDVIKCVSLDPAVLLTNAALAVLVTLIVGLSNAVLNASQALLRRPVKVVEPGENAGRISRAASGFVNAVNSSASKASRGVRAFFAPESWTVGTPGVRSGVSIAMLVIVIGLIALFAAFNDPEFNPITPRGVAIFLSLFGSIALVGVIYSQLQVRAARKLGWQAGRRIRPFALIIMLLGVVLSRAIGFLPGFLIAVPAGYALIAPPGEEADRAGAERRIAAAGLIGVIVIAVIAWLLALPVDLLIGNVLGQPQNAAGSIGLNVLGALQSVLLTVYVIALLLMAGTFLPYKSAAGQHIASGGWLMWGLGFGVITFVALTTIFNPGLAGLEIFGNASLLVIGAALAAISAVALSLWLSANEQTMANAPRANTRSMLLVFALLGAWLVLCGCGAVAFVIKTINWGNVLVAVIVIAIVALGGFVAIRIRAKR